jgi:hypothetical protein
MSTPETPSTPSPPSGSGKTMVQALWERMSLGAKLMCGGALVAIVASFLSAVSSSTSVSVGGFSASNSFSVMMIESGWRGIVALLACLGCGVIGILLSGERPAASKELSIAALAAGAVALIVTLWLFISISRATTGISFGGGESSTSAGIGLYLMVIASGACLAGGIMQARAARIF